MILKHVGGKCRFCPHHIRQALLELQRQQAAKEGIAAGCPQYGLRKIFFQCVWSRLHGKCERDDEDDDEELKIAEDASHESRFEDDQQSAGSTTEQEESDDDSIGLNPSKQKRKKVSEH
jgi:hypothetical protein